MERRIHYRRGKSTKSPGKQLNSEYRKYRRHFQKLQLIDQIRSSRILLIKCRHHWCDSEARNLQIRIRGQEIIPNRIAPNFYLARTEFIFYHLSNRGNRYQPGELIAIALSSLRHTTRKATNHSLQNAKPQPPN